MKKYVILISVYNDWESVFKLTKEIDLLIAKWDAEVSILIVNDASTEKRESIELNFKNIKSLKVINMIKNRGHARCHAAGLKFLTEKEDFNYVVLMDGDGEDRPEELTSIYNKSKENPAKVITADRMKRSEGPFFKFLYECHKILTFVFTGKFVKFGYYSCLPKHAVNLLIKESSLWSSFTGSLVKTISDRTPVPTKRGKRYYGKSQMNLFKLLVHSFSIIAVFKKSVITRSFLFIIFYTFFIYDNLSVITLLPILSVFIFLFIILKVSARENIEELNSSLQNIGSIDILSDLNSRQ